MYQTPLGPIPDQALAEAIQEISTPYDSFAVLLDSPGQEFPPEPSWLSGAVIAYVDESSINGDVGVRKQAMLIPCRQSTVPRGLDVVSSHLANDFIASAEKIFPTRSLKAKIDMLMGPTEPQVLEIARRNKLRTIAAFVLYEAHESDQHYSALQVPKLVLEGISLAFRQKFLDLDKGIQELGVKELFSDEFKQYGPDVRQNNPTLKTIGFLAAAVFLPPPEQVLMHFNAAHSTTAAGRNVPRLR